MRSICQLAPALIHHPQTLAPSVSSVVSVVFKLHSTVFQLIFLLP